LGRGGPPSNPVNFFILKAADVAGALGLGLPDSGCPSPRSRLKKLTAGNDGIGAAPGEMAELSFDGSPRAPSRISFAVRVFPEIESVREARVKARPSMFFRL
jgi:hypothetical protein